MSVFFPEEEVRFIYDFPLESLTARGIRGIVFDIDNTLMPPDAPADACYRILTQRPKAAGLRMYLVSNNKATRVLSFATAVNPPHAEHALKPRCYGYRKAMAHMGTASAETIAIGDQLFTDIWGVNRAGMHGLLAQPMESCEEIQIRLKRLLKRPMLALYRRERGAEK